MFLTGLTAGEGVAHANLYAESSLRAGRAARESTVRRCRSIYLRLANAGHPWRDLVIEPGAPRHS